MITARFLRRIATDRSGGMLIETAIVAPMLIMMALAGVEVSQMVLRQHELQAAISKVAEITLASPPSTATDLSNLRRFVAGSADIDETQVAATFYYRCNGTSAFHLARTGCTDKPKATKYVAIELSDRYVPIWASLGYGKPILYRVRRTIQLS